MSDINIQKKPLRVVVLMGGMGSERQISLQSGSCVVDALSLAGYTAMGWDCIPDRLHILNSDSVDVFFVALHGEFGEDGQLQQILTDKGCVYTGSTPETCRMAFDKMASKQCFNKAGVNTPPALAFSHPSDISNCVERARGWGQPWVIKPVRQGSSVGVHIVDQAHALEASCHKVLQDFGSGMIEQYIVGRELTVGFVGHQVLPVIEIKPKTKFYNYHAKYEDNHTEFLFDTVEPDRVSFVSETALTCMQALGLRHFGRIDFMLSNEGTLYVLEANAIPGLTSHSLLPKAAAQAGMSMGALCSHIVQAAYEDHVCKAPLDTSVGS